MFLFLKLILSFSLYAQSPTAVPAGFDHSYSKLNTLLSKAVVMKNNGQKSIVKYKAITSGEIDAVVKELLAAEKKQVMKDFSYKQRLSYFINLYNAMTIKLIKDNYKKVKSKNNSIKSIGSLLKNTWKIKFFTLFGKKTSLDEVEHGYIRGDLSGFPQSKKEYKDPRIHFAVNCASKGCPSLLNKAFLATSVTTQMQTAMENFLKDRSRNSVKNGKVYLSPIFKWYKKDFKRGFLGYSSLKGFVQKNSKHLTGDAKQLKLIQSGDFSIKYTDYDWTLNDAI